MASACSSSKSQTADAAIDGVAHVDAKVFLDAPATGGSCPGCTVNMCLPELQGCGTQSCLTGLMAFNDCMMAHGSTCGTTFGAGGAPQAALWSCLMTKCSASCGTT